MYGSDYYGSSYYAAQTFSDAPGGRRLLVAWMADGFTRTGVWAHLPWQSNMTVVRELRLDTIDGAPQVIVEPTPELRQLRAAPYHVADRAIAANTSESLPAAASGNQILAALMNMVSAVIYESRRATVERATDLKESVEFHRTIYRLIRAGKPDEARAAMSQHLELAQRAFASEEAPGSN